MKCQVNSSYNNYDNNKDGEEKEEEVMNCHEGLAMATGGSLWKDNSKKEAMFAVNANILLMTQAVRLPLVGKLPLGSSDLISAPQDWEGKVLLIALPVIVSSASKARWR